METFEINSTFDLYNVLYAVEQFGTLIQDYFWIASCFSNLFHLFILLHKELRSLGIYTIITGICIADLTIAIINLHYFAIKLSLLPEINPVPPPCLRSDYKDFVPVIKLQQHLEALAHRLTMWLTISLVYIRIISLKFYTKSWIKRMNKPRNTILYMMAGIAAFWLLLDSWQFLFTTVFWVPDNIADVCKVLPAKFIRQINVYAIPTSINSISKYIYELHPKIGIVSVVLLVTLTCILFRVRKRSVLENIESSDNTKLIMLMSLLFTITEVFGALVLAIPYLDKNIVYLEMSTTAIVATNNLRTLNSISHVFMCYSMSIQYKQVVRSLAFWRRLDVAVFDDVSMQTIYQPHGD